MIAPETLIFTLAGIALTLSAILVVKIIRNQPKATPNPWKIPPMNPARQRTIVTQKTLTPPPPQMFRQR